MFHLNKDFFKIIISCCIGLQDGGRMHVILNDEPLEEVDYFKSLGSQVSAYRWRM